jgi:hypothetical protein
VPPSWMVRCHLLWIDGSRSPVHAPLLGISVEKPWVSHNDRKVKGHFLARQWSLFLHLTFFPGPWSNDKVIIQGISGQLLEC